jgi:hypothetical protein
VAKEHGVPSAHAGVQLAINLEGSRVRRSVSLGSLGARTVSLGKRSDHQKRVKLLLRWFLNETQSAASTLRLRGSTQAERATSAPSSQRTGGLTVSSRKATHENENRAAGTDRRVAPLAGKSQPAIASGIGNMSRLNHDPSSPSYPRMVTSTAGWGTHAKKEYGGTWGNKSIQVPSGCVSKEGGNPVESLGRGVEIVAVRSDHDKSTGPGTAVGDWTCVLRQHSPEQVQDENNHEARALFYRARRRRLFSYLRTSIIARGGTLKALRHYGNKFTYVWRSTSKYSGPSGLRGASPHAKCRQVGEIPSGRQSSFGVTPSGGAHLGSTQSSISSTKGWPGHVLGESRISSNTRHCELAVLKSTSGRNWRGLTNHSAVLNAYPIRGRVLACTAIPPQFIGRGHPMPVCIAEEKHVNVLTEPSLTSRSASLGTTKSLSGLPEGQVGFPMYERGVSRLNTRSFYGVRSWSVINDNLVAHVADGRVREALPRNTSACISHTVGSYGFQPYNGLFSPRSTVTTRVRGSRTVLHSVRSVAFVKAASQAGCLKGSVIRDTGPSLNRNRSLHLDRIVNMGLHTRRGLRRTDVFPRARVLRSEAAAQALLLHSIFITRSSVMWSSVISHVSSIIKLGAPTSSLIICARSRIHNIQSPGYGGVCSPRRPSEGSTQSSIVDLRESMIIQRKNIRSMCNQPVRGYLAYSRVHAIRRTRGIVGYSHPLFLRKDCTSLRTSCGKSHKLAAAPAQLLQFEERARSSRRPSLGNPCGVVHTRILGKPGQPKHRSTVTESIRSSEGACGYKERVFVIGSRIHQVECVSGFSKQSQWVCASSVQCAFSALRITDQLHSVRSFFDKASKFGRVYAVNGSYARNANKPNRLVRSTVSSWSSSYSILCEPLRRLGELCDRNLALSVGRITRLSRKDCGWLDYSSMGDRLGSYTLFPSIRSCDLAAAPAQLLRFADPCEFGGVLEWADHCHSRVQVDKFSYVNDVSVNDAVQSGAPGVVAPHAISGGVCLRRSVCSSEMCGSSDVSIPGPTQVGSCELDQPTSSSLKAYYGKLGSNISALGDVDLCASYRNNAIKVHAISQGNAYRTASDQKLYVVKNQSAPRAFQANTHSPSSNSRSNEQVYSIRTPQSSLHLCGVLSRHRKSEFKRALEAKLIDELDALVCLSLSSH